MLTSYTITIRPKRQKLFYMHWGSALRKNIFLGFDGKTVANRKRNRTNLNPGQFGCWLSHRFAWRLSALSTAPYVLIFEDDARAVTPTTFVSMVHKSVAELPEDWDVLLLGRNPKKTGNLLRISEHTVLTGAFWGAFAYVLTPKAAGILWQWPPTKVDRLLSTLAANGTLNVYALDPPLCIYEKQFVSDTYRIT